MKPISVMLLFLVSIGCNNTTSQNINYEWPCFHGPDRTNKSPETGLAKEWPVNGPALHLTIEGFGEGFSSVSIANDMIYTAGLINNESWVFAFDLQGKLVWKKQAGRAWSTTASWASSYTGPRSTPTYDNGILYFLGEMGRLTAFESKTGQEIWHRDLMEEFIAPVPEYGYAESVMIDGNNLYVRPAGKEGHQVCLDKTTGKLIWANATIPGVEGYTSPVIGKIGGHRQVVGASSVCYYGADAGSGKLLWKIDVINDRECNIADAILYNDYVFITSGYGKGSMLYKLNVKGEEIVPEKIWESSLMDNHHGGAVLHDGFIYGSGNRARGWYCLEFMTGEQRWKETNSEGSLTFADGMLYILEPNGIMKLVKASPEKYEIAGEFKVPSGGKGNYWAHPVICNERLYIRHADKIFIYDISGK